MTEELTPKPAGRVRGRRSRTGQAPPRSPRSRNRKARRRGTARRRVRRLDPQGSRARTRWRPYRHAALPRTDSAAMPRTYDEVRLTSDRERRRHRRRDEGGHLRTRACEEIGVYYAISGWISAVRSLRQPRRGFLRVRKFLNAIDHVPHAEGALGRVSKHAPKPMQRLRALRGRFPRTLACRHHDHRRRGGDDGGGVDTFVWAIETRDFDRRLQLVRCCNP